MIATSSSIHVAQMMRDPRYGKLDNDDKAECEARLDMCLRIDACTNKRAAFLAEAGRTHSGQKWSEHTIRKLYYEKWVASGRSWWKIRNEAKIPDDAPELPQDFIVRYWHPLCFRMGGRRRHKKAWRQLQSDWRNGTPVDGFPLRGRGHDLPRGLSYENLMRPKYRPKPLADTIAAVGLKAAHSHLPSLLTTRLGLPFGARYVFDDLKHDAEVTVPGQTGLRELWQFHALELLSGYQVARGYKAAALNAKTDTMEKLKERELLFLLAHLLCHHGYNPDGCILYMERGTATVREEIEALLWKWSDQKVLVQRGATSTGALAPGLYGGQSGGNPRFKAALESLGNLVHIESSDRLRLPAQTGSNARIDRPEELHGREQHLTLLQRCALTLAPEQRELVTKFVAPPAWQAIALLEELQEKMNWREDHELEGWESCGFTVGLWRLMEHQPWEPQTSLAQLPAEERAIIQARLRANPKLSSARRLSPGEVYHGFSDTLTRLPLHALPALIGMEHSQEKRVGKDGDFHFEDENLGPDEHHYSGVVTDGEGKPARLAAGEKYATFVSAIDPSRLYLCDAKGGYVGWAERLQLGHKADAFAMARAYGRRMQAHRELLAPVLAAARPLWQKAADGAALADSVFAQAAEKKQRAEKEPAAPRAVSTEQKQQNARRATQVAALALGARRDEAG